MEKALEFMLLVLSCIINIAAVVTLVITIVKKAKSPHDVQNDRLDQHEKDINDLKAKLKQTKNDIESMEEGQRITQRALLALLSHGIDGNGIDKMQKAKDALEEYLIEG